MSLTYKYKRVKRPDKSDIKSPSLSVTLWGSGLRYDFVALLDSGADISVISLDVAELLGLDLKGNKEEARGIGGKVFAIQTNMNIELGKPHERYSFKIPVKVIFDNGEEELPIILGRVGFFDKFVVTFDQKNEKIILKKNME